MNHVANLPADGLTPQLGVPGPWHERLPHFRMDSAPASVLELETEYFVPRAHAVPALKAVEGLRDLFKSLLLISEVRSVAADRLWLSQSYGTPTIGIHFSWRMNWRGVHEVMPLIEEALSPYDVRPHWGKLFTLPAGACAGCLFENGCVQGTVASVRSRRQVSQRVPGPLCLRVAEQRRAGIQCGLIRSLSAP